MFVISQNQIAVVVLTLSLMQCLATGSASSQTTDRLSTGPAGLPENALWREDLSSRECQVYQHSQTLWIAPTKDSADSHQFNIPRLCAPIRSFAWTDDPSRDLKFVPEQKYWTFSWVPPVAPDAFVKVEFDAEPRLPAQCSPAIPTGDSSVMLFAHEAIVSGEKLRFEPQWYKNTVGYWTIPSDYASWKLEFKAPGKYAVAVLQGCGAGQGGSDALITLRDTDAIVAEVPFQTVDTGHFQNFRWNHLGHITVKKAGSYQLRIEATKIAKDALFDVRNLQLVKQAQ